MTTTTQQKVPALRFKDEQGNDFPDWQEKQLGKVAKFKNGKAHEQNIDVAGKYIVVNSKFISSEGVVKKFSSNQICPLYKGNIVLVMSDVPKGKALAKCFYIERDDAYTLNQRICSLSSEKIDPLFLYLITNRNKYFLKFDTGVTQTNLRKEEVLRCPLNIPELLEQQKIATFLSAVNTKIEQLNNKKALWEQYKKGMMQKLFNQEIRFKDEQGNDYPDWEEKTFGDISRVKRGASPRPISSPKWFSENSRIGWVRISDITSSNKYLKKTTQYLSNEGVKKSRFIPKWNIVMSICATIGKPIYTGFDVCIHDGFVVFEGLNVNKEFIYYFLEKMQKRWYRYGQPGTQVNLNSDIVSNEKIRIPKEAEQQKIANFLSAVDTKIELVTTELKQARTFKKGLLQQMFI